MSLVLVSPSTVTALKVRATMPGNAARSASWSTRASVKAKANMVAMSGWIMPLPLAVPTMRAPVLSVA